MPLNLYSKESIDTLLADKLDLAGGTMTGALTLSASGIIFSDATYLTTAPAGSTLAADQLTAGVVATNPSTGPTTAGDVLQYNGTDLVWAAGGGGGGVAWGAITGTVTDQTDLTTYLGSNYYPLSGNPSGFLTAVPTKTVTNYTASATLSLSDVGNIIYLSGYSSFSVTIDEDSVTYYPTGSEITVIVDNTSGGYYSLQPGSFSVSINATNSFTITNYVSKLVKVASNTWYIS
jgi:hypothetical protein